MKIIKFLIGLWRWNNNRCPACNDKSGPKFAIEVCSVCKATQNGTEAQWRKFKMTLGCLILMCLAGCAEITPQLVQTPAKGDAIAAAVATKVDAKVENVKAAFKESEINVKANQKENGEAQIKSLNNMGDALTNEVRNSANEIRRAVTISNAAGDPWVFRIAVISNSLCMILLAWQVSHSTPTPKITTGITEERARKLFLENQRP
jgi:hypothetical protein